MTVLDPSSLNFQTIKTQLRAYLAAKPGGSAWTSFFLDDSSGGTIVELLAAVSELLQYHTIVGRAEAYLFSARLLSSLIAIAETKSYSTFRGQRTHYSLNVTPNFSGTFNAFTSIGTARGLQIVCMTTTPATNGIAVNVPVVIGNLNSEQQTVPSGKTFFFRFISPGMSEDVQLLLGNIVQTTSKNVIDLLNNLFLSLSNPVGALDLYSLNQNGQYDTGNIFTLNFVDMGIDPVIALSDIVFNQGTVNSLTPDSNNPRMEVETNQSIAVNAALNSEVQRLIRGRLDYQKAMRALDTAFVSTSEKDLSNAQVVLSYCRSDLALILMSEKVSIINTLNSFRPMGIAPPSIVDPVQDALQITVTITLVPGIAVPGSLTTKVQNIVNQFQEQLGTTVNLATIEGQVNALLNDSGQVFIQRTRVAITSFWGSGGSFPQGSVISINPDNGFYYQSLANIELKWAASTAHLVGDYVVAIGSTGYGNLFQVLSAIGDTTTGLSEPNWATIPNPGNSLTDNNVVWINVGPVIPKWLASHIYAAGATVSPNTLTTVDVPTFTGGGLNDMTTSGSYTGYDTESWLVQIDGVGSGITPDTFKWSKNGGTTWQQTLVPIVGAIQQLDNGVTIAFAATTGHTLANNWAFSVRRLYVRQFTNPTTKWQGSTVYTIGQIVIPNPSSGFAFQCTVGGTSGTTPSQPTWPSTLGSTVGDNTVTWKNIGTSIRTWDAAVTHSVNDIIESLSPLGSFFKCTSISGTGTTGGAEPAWDTVVGHTTTDNPGGNQIVWTCINPLQSGVAEPSWPLLPGQIVRDINTTGSIVWQIATIGLAGGSLPSFPTVIGRSVVDGTVLWIDIGSSQLPFVMLWNQFLVITTVVVTQ